jgi:hypothetical protein
MLRLPAKASNDGLAVEFLPGQVQSGHEIFLGRQRVLSSVESGDACPASPPLQHVVVQAMKDGSSILGVGAAGRSHWSASFSMPDGTDSLVIEIACRIQSPLAWLGSTYAVSEPMTEPETRDGTILLQAGQDVVAVVPGERTHAEFDTGSRQIRITPQRLPAGPGTAQWKFRIARAGRRYK